MKRAKMFLIVGCLIAAMAPRISSAASAATIVSKDALTEGSYCHIKFPAIVEETLGTTQPVLKNPSEGDIIDFYGPWMRRALIDKIFSRREFLSLCSRQAK